MATLTQTNPTVTTTATLVLTSRVGGSRVKFGNSAGKIIYLGDETVTKDNGLKLQNNAIETFEFASRSLVYAVVATGTATLDILEY